MKVSTESEIRMKFFNSFEGWIAKLLSYERMTNVKTASAGAPQVNTEYPKIM